MGLTYLFIFVLEDELDTPAYPEDFQEVKVKDEPMEYVTVSCDLFYHPNSMLIFIIFSYNIEDQLPFYEVSLLFVL